MNRYELFFVWVLFLLLTWASIDGRLFYYIDLAMTDIGLPKDTKEAFP